MAAPYVGLDVGTNAFHAVAIDESHSSIAGRVFAADEVDALVDWAAPARVIAIDAPDRPSTGAHLGDERVAEKFREGRCAEVALGVGAGYWVPWVTPAKPVPGSWIDVGIGLHGRLRDDTGADVIEVFPHACFRHLAAGDPLPTKSSVDGMRARVALLEAEGVDDPHLDLWSHDSIDAAVAALVAAQYSAGAAEGLGCPPGSACGQDGSVIWLPANPARAAPS